MDRWTELFLLFSLVLFRMAGFLAFATFLGSRNIPVIAKMVFAVCLSALVFPAAMRISGRPPDTLGDFISFAAIETVIGIVFGFVSSLLFAGIQMAGQIIGNKMGFSMANAVDPFTEAEVTLVEEFKFFLAVFLFLLAGGHHLMVRGLAATYEVVPVGGAHLRLALWWELSGQFGTIFLAALQAAAPVAGAMFLVTLGMGFVARSVPQVNVMMISFPVQIAAGLILIIAFLPVVVVAVARSMGRLDASMGTVTRLLMP